MAPTNWDLLSQADEGAIAPSSQVSHTDRSDALHNITRLLSIEARPFLRISNRLTKNEASGNTRPSQLVSPPPDASAADEEAAARAVSQEQESHRINVWQRELMNELDLLDHTVLRFELTTESNNDERERYAKEKVAILDKQNRVKEDIEQLRIHLQEAKEKLALRKSYDEESEKIYKNKMLKPRDEQGVAHAKLDEEIAELEQEVQNAKTTWAERRDQFNRIEAEATNLMRMIKDEKEEAERKEGMMKDQDDEADGEGGSIRGDISMVGTPRPDGAITPLHVSQSAESSNSLKVPQDRLAPLSRDPSAAPSPARSGMGENAEMGGEGDNVAELSSELSEIEEGEDLEEGEDDGERSGRADASERDMDES